MTQQEFIKTIAGYVQKYAPMFNIGVCSPVIAQAILESAYGTSFKAQYNNYFGLKYRKDRVTCNSGYFEDGGSEQELDGSYTPLPSDTTWYAFDNMEMGVLGYFQYTNIERYDNLKGVTDPYKYLENIKADGYATSLDYVKNVYAVIEKWNLTQYDKEVENMSIKIQEHILTNSPCNQSGRTIEPKGGMLHSIGCPQPDPLVIAKNMSTSTNACVHAVVGKEKVVYQLLPWNRRGWHCGSGANGSGNNTLISIEMTEPATIKYTGGASWIEIGDGSNTKSHVLATYANAVEFFAFICQKYGLNPENSDVLMSHCEGNRKGIASNHGDVEHIWNKYGLSMNQFRVDVKKAMQGEVIPTVPTVPVDNSSDDTSSQAIKDLSGNVTVIYQGADGLNVRKAPSITADIDQVVHEGVFTVKGISADEKWYQLKSGLFITTITDYVSFKATAEQKQQTAGTGYFRVRKSWGEANTQIGAFKDQNNAIELCKQNSGYKVFNDSGVEIYPCVKEQASTSFMFQVNIPDLRIRKGAGTTYDYWKKNGSAVYTGKNTFTIVKTKEGQGAKLWGLLKSYADNEDGWIALDEEYGVRL